MKSCEQWHLEATGDAMDQVDLVVVQAKAIAYDQPLKVSYCHHEFHTPELPVGLNAMQVISKRSLECEDEDQSKGAQNVDDALSDRVHVEMIPITATHAILV
mmetsp:Transcript_49178/g.92208  ORF Transcript_49178/g.92208 Transcript_49178/m.92208 type:complete len:102 (-) Transcript_49178:583-888(-)